MPDGLTVKEWNAMALRCLADSPDFNTRTLAGVLVDILHVSDDPAIGRVLDRWSSMLLERDAA